MTAEIRALPGLTQQSPDLPKVTRNIDDHKYAVTVDFSNLVDLQGFFRAVGNDPDLRWAVQNLMLNKGTSSESRDLRTACAARLRKATGFAFTVTLTPEDAERLHEDLAANALEPARCEGDYGDCSNFVEDDGSFDSWSGLLLCPSHLAIVQGGA